MTKFSNSVVSGNTLEVLKKIPDGANYYITFDADGLDPSIMPATGTPVPKGLSYKTAFKILSTLTKKREILGFDFFTSKVKKNPWYEKQAIRLIDNEKENFIYSLMKHDYLLNLMFAKNIIRKMPNIESNFYSFLEGRSIKDFFDFFKKNL